MTFWNEFRKSLNVKLSDRNALKSCTIANGAALSYYVDLSGSTLVALALPANYAGGNITFQASDTAGGTYQDVYDAFGNLVTLTVGGASRVVCVTGVALQALASLQYIKIKCASNAAADVTLKLITKG